MNRFNSFIMKLKFKKIIIGYIIALIAVGIICALGIGYVYRDSIKYAYGFSQLEESFEDSSLSQDQIKAKMDTLAASSSKVEDILLLDKNNNVLYSAKKTEFGNAGQLKITKENDDNHNFLCYNNNVIFKIEKSDEFAFDSIFAEGKHRDINREYKDESFFKEGSGNKSVYLLSYIGNNNGDKIYFINNTADVNHGELALKAVAAAAMLLFMIYWVFMALYVYQNALKVKLYATFWGIIVLCTNIAGVLVYILYKHNSAACKDCGALQSKTNIFCTTCGNKISASCSQCNAVIGKHDNYCPKCGNKIKQPHKD